MSQWRIKLHRKITKREWYTDANTFRVFVHCLMMANHESKERRWQKIDRWQFVTSATKMWAELWLSRQQIRTSISKLEVTNNITIKSTKQYSIITIVNYWDYNDEQKNSNQQNNHQSTHRITTTKEYKNNSIIYITQKSEIKNLLEKSYIEKNWYALKILYELFIEKWYKLELKESKVKDFVSWLEKKVKVTFWLDQLWNLKWEKAYNAIEDCMTYHEADKKLKRKQTYKARVNTWFSNIRNKGY